MAGNPVETSVSSAGVGVKAIKAQDVDGNVIYIQALVAADADGEIVHLLTERTGRAILASLRELVSITKKTNKLLP